jgi:hypothetical protein
MLTILLYSVFVLWAGVSIVALILCDISARREARARVIKARRQARQLPSRVAIDARGL